jgi:phytoene dehydrogenase-like protein
MSVVVVGAGLSGIACATELVAAGVPVRVLDRADHVGGRMATCRTRQMGSTPNGLPSTTTWR